MQSLILGFGIILLSGTMTYDQYFNKADVAKVDSGKVILNQEK